MKSGESCSDRLSPGPADADVEIVLGGLPESTDAKPVHLAFWSARRSATEYDPLESPKGASVWRNFFETYPKYYDEDFNGGNVRVSAAGQATIRVRKPSTYNVHHHTPVPHVHLRVCEGDNFMYRSSHKVNFAKRDTWVQGTSWPFKIRLISAQEYTNRTDGGDDHDDDGSPPMVIGGTDPEDPDNPDEPDEPTDPDDGSPLQVLIDAARDALEVDALEFSPVYRCLLEGAFFNHFTAKCADECPDDSAVVHGQCVRPETVEERAEFGVTWELEIECGTPCWHGRKLTSLHDVRLSVAGEFGIPFQEVKVSMGFLPPDSRRLADMERREALLTVKVDSNRLSPQEGSELQNFVSDAHFLEQLLGLHVLSASVVTAPNGDFLEEPVALDQDTDPYVPAYTDLEPVRAPPPPSTALSFLPVPAIIGIAAAVVVILSVVVGSMLWKRRRAQQNANAQRAEAKAADLPKVEDNAEPNNKVAAGDEADAERPTL